MVIQCIPFNRLLLNFDPYEIDLYIQVNCFHLSFFLFNSDKQIYFIGFIQGIQYKINWY